MNKKDNNIEENRFMELWHNKRTHAAMVLGLWLIFLLFVMIISFIGGKATKTPESNIPVTEEKEETPTFKNYEVMQKELINSNFSYVYTINIGDYKVVYRGEKTNNLDTGYKETAEETIKYQVDETGLYKVVMDELNAYDRLYENLNESLLDLEYIFETVKDKPVLTEELGDTRNYTYKFTLEEIEYEIIVSTNLENITKISVKYEDKLYDLNYTEIKNEVN